MCESTSTQMIGETFYCSYCGEKAKHRKSTKWAGNYYFCDCEGAQLELEIRETNKKRERLMEEAFPKLKKLRYLDELETLNAKYGIIAEVHDD